MTLTGGVGFELRVWVLGSSQHGAVFYNIVSIAKMGAYVDCLPTLRKLPLPVPNLQSLVPLLNGMNWNMFL